LGAKMVCGQVEFTLDTLDEQAESGQHLMTIGARGTSGRELENLIIWIQRLADEPVDRLPPAGTTALRCWASRADLVTGEIVAHAMYRDGAAVRKTSTRVAVAVGSNGILVPQLTDPSLRRATTGKGPSVMHRTGYVWAL
jgi:hypothetical protein